MADDTFSIADDSPTMADDSFSIADDSPTMADDSFSIADDTLGMAEVVVDKKSVGDAYGWLRLHLRDKRSQT